MCAQVFDALNKMSTDDGKQDRTEKKRERPGARAVKAVARTTHAAASTTNAALGGAFDPLAEIVQDKDNNQVIALAVGSVISAVVVKAVDDLTSVVYNWAGASPTFAPIRNALNINILGAELNIPHILGIFFYIVLSIGVLALVVFGVLKPLLDSDLTDDEN